MRSQTAWAAILALVIAALVLVLVFSKAARRPLHTAPQRGLYAVGCIGTLIAALAVASTGENAKYAFLDVLSLDICGNCTHTRAAYVAAVTGWLGIPSLLLAYGYAHTVGAVVHWVRTGRRQPIVVDHEGTRVDAGRTSDQQAVISKK